MQTRSFALSYPTIGLIIHLTRLTSACMLKSTHMAEEDAHGVWVTDVVSIKLAPSSALSCLTRRESIYHPANQSINRRNA